MIRALLLLLLWATPVSAQMGLLQPQAGLLGSPTDYGVTWNPSDKNANVTLSTGNRVATGTSASYGLVRATSFKSTGKWSFILKCIVTGQSVTDYTWIGLADAGLSTSAAPGTTAGTFSWISNIFQLFQTQMYSGSTPTTPRGWPGCTIAGDNMLIAVDLDNALFWTRTNNTGNWNNVGGADPDTGTGGLAFPNALTFPTTIAATIGVGAAAQVSELCAADVCAAVTRPSTFPWWTP